MGAIVGIWWLLVGWYADANARIWQWFTQVFLERGFFPGGLNPIHFTKWFWLLFGLTFVLVAYYKWGTGARLRFGSRSHYSYDRRHGDPLPPRSKSDQMKKYVFSVIGSLSIALSVFVWCINQNDRSASYAGSTVFVVEDTANTPTSLKRLVEDTSPDENGCALYAYNDMRGCIEKGSYDFEWESRTASATGAETVIRRSSGAVQNTELLADTLTYIYAEDGKGIWTAIRDGKSRQPLYGISYYGGSGNVDICRFTGEYAINKAFGGRWGTNLSDEIAGRYPELHYSTEDRYGYCEGKKPVIVIPVKEQIAFRTRTTFRSAGVLVITGSPSGDAQYEHVRNLKPGDLPGPVYPSSLAMEQRQEMEMIAGIWDNWTGKFGFEPTEVETQAGNASEYQLRDRKTGRIFWVTPMKPRSSDSQTLSTYSVIPADTATSGSLNQLDIYVLPDDDPRIVNLSDLEARTKQAITEEDPGFYSAGGALVEFLPLGNNQWQVYAELSGRVVYRVLISSDARVRPSVTNLVEDATPPPPSGEEPATPPNGSLTCSGDLTKLSDSDLAVCLSNLAGELRRRN